MPQSQMQETQDWVRQDSQGEWRFYPNEQEDWVNKQLRKCGILKDGPAIPAAVPATPNTPSMHQNTTPSSYQAQQNQPWNDQSRLSPVPHSKQDIDFFGPSEPSKQFFTGSSFATQDSIHSSSYGRQYGQQTSNSQSFTPASSTSQVQNHSQQSNVDMSRLPEPVRNAISSLTFVNDTLLLASANPSIQRWHRDSQRLGQAQELIQNLHGRITQLEGDANTQRHNFELLTLRIEGAQGFVLQQPGEPPTRPTDSDKLATLWWYKDQWVKYKTKKQEESKIRQGKGKGKEKGKDSDEDNDNDDHGDKTCNTLYITDFAGQPVAYHIANDMRVTLRSIIGDLRQHNKLASRSFMGEEAASYTELTDSAISHIIARMEAMHPELRFCDNHWKAKWLLSDNFSHIIKSKAQPRGSKTVKKRVSTSLVIDIEDDQGDGPPLKKGKLSDDWNGDMELFDEVSQTLFHSPPSLPQMSLPQANASTSVSKGSNVSSLRPPLKPTQPQAPHPQLAPTTLIRPQPPRACPPLAPTRPQLPNTQQLQASTQSRVHTKSTAGPTKTSAQTVRKMPTQPRPAPPQPVWTPEQNRRPYPKPRPTQATARLSEPSSTQGSMPLTNSLSNDPLSNSSGLKTSQSQSTYGTQIPDIQGHKNLPRQQSLRLQQNLSHASTPYESLPRDSALVKDHEVPVHNHDVQAVSGSNEETEEGCEAGDVDLQVDGTLDEPEDSMFEESQVPARADTQPVDNNYDGLQSFEDSTRMNTGHSDHSSQLAQKDPMQIDTTHSPRHDSRPPISEDSEPPEEFTIENTYAMAKPGDCNKTYKRRLKNATDPEAIFGWTWKKENAQGTNLEFATAWVGLSRAEREPYKTKSEILKDKATAGRIIAGSRG